MAQLLDTDHVHDTPRRDIANPQEVSMITTIISWLAHTWAALGIVTARDWLYYLLALPVIAVIAWFTLPSEDVDEESEDERECRYW